MDFKDLAYFSLYNFFEFSLTWDLMGEKDSNNISSKSTKQIHSKQIMDHPKDRSYKICLKISKILQFVYVYIYISFFQFLLFFPIFSIWIIHKPSLNLHLEEQKLEYSVLKSQKVYF